MTNTKIEWCDDSWNPITGCRHGCKYCYARRLAKRFGGVSNYVKFELKQYNILSERGINTDSGLCVLSEREVKFNKNGKEVYAPYPAMFTPTLHEYRLNDLDKLKNSRTIFVGSMTDMFGDWLPAEWIDKVLDECKQYPQHRYLFLTKNPKRYLELAKKGKLPTDSNFWYGTSTPTSVVEFFESEMHNCFLSIEPLLGGDWTNGKGLRNIKWIIIGAETGNRKGKVKPKIEWMKDIIEQAKNRNIPVYMKNSLIPILGEQQMLREFPWQETANS
jgi:protein gp37